MMTDSHSQPSGREWPPAKLSQGEAIRLLADEELSESEIRSICSETFGDDSPARIRCEKALRERIAHVMGETTPAPQALRAAVERICAGDAGEPGESTHVIDPEMTRSPGFWSAARTLAMAAALALLVAASVLLWPGNPASPFHPTEAGPFGGQSTQVAGFIDREHNRCAALDDYFQRKFDKSSPEEAKTYVGEYLGLPCHALSLEEQGYRMAGISPCAVPGDGASVHIIYESMSPAGRPVSLFIQEAPLDRGLKSGVCYCIPVEGDATLQAWRQDGLIYYLFSGEGEPPSDVRTALDAPETRMALSGHFG